MTRVTPPRDDPAQTRSGRHRPPARARVAAVAPPPGHPPLPGVALVTYVVLAFTFSWLWWVPMAVRGQVANPGQGWPTHLPGLLGPAFAAIVVVLGWHGTSGLRELGHRAVRWRGVGRWWWAVPAILALGAVGVAVSAAAGHPVDLGGLAEYSGAPVVSAVLLVGYVLHRQRLRRGARLARRAGRRPGRPGRRGAGRAAGHRGVGDVAPAAVLGGRGLPLDGLGHVGWVLGLLAGSVVLTRLYVGSGRSVLLVALWHTAFNFTTATTATQGLSAAITSTAVVVAAVVVLVRAGRRERAEAAARAALAAERRARLAGETTAEASVEPAAD